MEIQLAKVTDIARAGRYEYGTAATYRSREMRRSGGEVEGLYETLNEMLARLECDEGWRCFSVTNYMDTWVTAHLRRELPNI